MEIYILFFKKENAHITVCFHNIYFNFLPSSLTVNKGADLYYCISDP